MQHGDHDAQQEKWYCGYWMSLDEWLDVHDYAPPSLEKPGGEAEEEE